MNLEIECPCNYIIDGEIDSCQDCPYVEDEEQEATPVDKKEEFGVEIIARGAFVDTGVEPGRAYCVEIYTLRLNHVAVNEYIFTTLMNNKDCYSKHEEWLEYLDDRRAKLEEWKNRIINMVKCDVSKGGISITQAQSEVFTLVHIWEMK